jgi:hypothetical protein
MRSKVMLSILLVIGFGFAASANLLTNPGFETGTLNGWDSNGYSIGQDADAHSGAYGAARDIATGIGSGAYFIMDQSVPVTPGLSYDASCWMRYAGTANNSEQFMEIQWVYTDGIHWDGVGTTPVSGPQDYTLYQLNNLIAPAGAVSADVRAVVHTTDLTAGASAQHTFDDFNFAAQIPEPATLGLFGLAGIILTAMRRRLLRR